MKLFTKGIDKKLFAQYPKGGSLEGQKVIAKIFNPYGRGRWYIMNSDPDEPDYLWGIVELFQGEPEVGSFSREELENIKVGAFKLPLERDLYFDETDAMEVYNGLKSGKTFEHGGEMENRRTLRLSDAVLYRGEMYTLIKRNNEIGFVSSAQGAWGSDQKFMPLSKMFRSDLEENLTDMKGNKFNIPSYDELMQQPYGFMEHGGEMDKGAEMLKGKYVNIFSMGVENPISTDIVEAEMSDPKFRYQTLSLKTRGGGEEIIEGKEKINSFLKGEMVFVRDSSEEYGIQLVDTFAKGGKLQIVKDEDKNQGKLHYERYKGAIGSFAWIDGTYNEGILHPLDDFDKKFYSHLKLKEGEMLFRYKSLRITSEWYFPLVKINLDKMLVYFLEDSDDDRNPTFNSRGTKLEYLAIEEYYYEVREFAKGGEMDKNSYSISIKQDDGRPIMALINEAPKELEAQKEYEKNGFYIDKQLGFKGLLTFYVKNIKILKEITNPKYHSQIDEVIALHKTESKSGKLDYTSKRNITNVKINYKGKEYLVSGDDVITGAYKFAKGGLLANGKTKYDKGDEGMYEGKEVRVVKLNLDSNLYDFNVLDEDGNVKTSGSAPKEKFENQFRYFPNSKGGLSDTHIYIPKRDVIKVTTKDGESINSPLNGVWVKKEYFDGKEAKVSGSYEPSQATKGVADKLKDFKKDKSITASVKDDIIYNLSFEDGFVSDLKYEIENNISGLAIETYANAVKSVSKKNKLRVAKNLAFYGNPNVLNLFPESFTKTPLLTKKAISMKGNLLNNTAFLSELGKFTSDDALRPAMTAIRFDGKSVVATDANVLVHIYQDVSVEPQNLCMTKICETSKGEDSRYPDWKAIIARHLNDSKYKSQTFDLDKLIVIVNWINNYYSVWDSYMRTFAITTKDGDIAFNPELLLKTLTMLKVMGVKKPIMYYESGNRAVYFGEEGKLSGDPSYDNFILLMPLLNASAESFSLDITTNEYKIVVPSFAKGGKMGDGKQLSIFA